MIFGIPGHVPYYELVRGLWTEKKDWLNNTIVIMDPCLNPFLHVAEFLVGVPYYYNKLTKVNYYKNTKKVNRYFSSSVRYLNLDFQIELGRLKKELTRKKIVKSTSLGASKIYFFSALEI